MQYYCPNFPDDAAHSSIRPALDVRELSKCLGDLLDARCLEITTSDENGAAIREKGDSGRSSGRKRAASPDDKSSKRQKISADSYNASENAPSSSTSDGAIQELGPLSNKESNQESFSGNLDRPTCIPVFQHTLELQYTKANPSDIDQRLCANTTVAGTLGWVEQENSLESVAQNCRDQKGTPLAFGLGAVNFEYLPRVGHLFVFLDTRKDLPIQLDDIVPLRGGEWYLLVPRVQWPDGMSEKLGDFDIGPSCLQEDMLLACYNLQLAGRAKIDANIRITILPSGTYNAEQDLPIRFHLEYTVSLVLPNIYRPPMGLQKRQLLELEDAQRRFLSYTVLTPAANSLPHFGDVDIPFLYSILHPAPSNLSPLTQDAIQPAGLQPTLLPFQRRTLAWMLEREGKKVAETGQVVLVSDTGDDALLPLFWEKVVLSGHTLYINRLSGVVSADAPHTPSAFGGILAEEPGLGKTLECISLILLNPSCDRDPNNVTWDPQAKLHVKEIKTTLIVTPPSLAPQWADELANHAPTLKVLIYDGWSKLGVLITAAGKKFSKTKDKAKAQADDSDFEMGEYDDNPASILNGIDSNDQDTFDWCSYINTFDVCITTYNVLRQDLAIARAPHTRPRRQDVVYSNAERPRSPLVMCEWYRVIMDEVQMMGSGKSEEMVALIPRISSFAVSGTPARSQVADLIHVLKFLRVDSLIGSIKMWNRLLKPGMKDHFAALFQRYAVRTMKSTVKAELTIPQQTRYLVSIEQGRVERHVYDRRLEASLGELGLDARGVAASEGWQVNPSLLRSLLRQLRGICTHPQVGQLQKLGDRLFKPGALKSMSDVLEAMKDQNWRNYMDDRKTKIQSIVRFAQLQQHDGGNRDRYQRSLDSLLLAEKDLDQYIEDMKNAMLEHNAKGETLKTDAVALPGSQGPSQPNGKGKMRESSILSEDESEDGDLPHTPAGEEHRVKKRVLQQRIRDSYMALHQIKFLQGDLYHTLGPSQSNNENAAYEAAETIRKNLLKATEESALRAMASLKLYSPRQGVTEKALLIETPYLGARGKKTRHLMKEANKIINSVLNQQTSLLWQWRSRILTLLTEKLSAGSDEADGQEYSRTLETQGDAEIYLQVYASLLADRRQVLMAERTLLAAHDAKETKTRNTTASRAAAAEVCVSELEIPDDVDLQPQHELQHKELSDARKGLLEQTKGRAIKSIIVDLTAIAARIPSDKNPIKILAKATASRLRSLVVSQGALMDKLDAELGRLRKAFNERILYFRHLQEISDTVAEVSWDGGLLLAMEICMAEQADLDGKINTSRARQRYLDHLTKNKEEGIVDEDDESCILCRCEFTRGFITQCAHVFCEGCIKAWLVRKEGKACPVCRVGINVDQLQRFVVKGEDRPVPVPEQPVLTNHEPALKSQRKIEYNMIDPKLFQEIESMEPAGSYGSKIQTLVRHLLYLQVTEPGSKSIVFSAWADSLHIIEHALAVNGIQCLRIDQATRKGKESIAKKFRTDPEILVLLLHGERENAGLNITCASRVFLVESVVHHGFEVQAIARIDRMGQTKPTEVFCYYAEDTVERNILDLAARQGLSLYTKDNYAGTLNVTPFAMDAGKKSVIDAPAKTKKVQKGDFIFKVDDMLAILFPHMFEDIQYLIHEDELQEQHTSPSTRDGMSVQNHVNAIAGPSRLSY